MRQKLVALVIGAALATALALPAFAHEGYRSCEGGAPGAVAELGGIPPGPDFGTLFVAPLATGGIAAPTVELLHSLVCDPAP